MRRIFLYILFLILAFAFYFIHILPYGAQPSSAISFGCYCDEICFAEQNRHLLPAGAVVFHSGGYDGQFYYYIAAGIFGGKDFSVDFLPFRLSRILYPVLTGPFYLFGGPDGLILAMALIPLVMHMASAELLYRRLSSRGTARAGLYTAMVLLLFNPLWIVSFLLNVSDALAYSFAAMAVLFLFSTEKKTDESPNRNGSQGFPFIFKNNLMYFVFASFSILTKETFLALPLALFVATPIYFISTGSKTFEAFWRPWIYLTPLVPLFLWWLISGFSPLMASSRGGLPLEGALRYLENPDAMISGRSFLIALFFILLSLAATKVKGFYDDLVFRNGPKNQNGAPGIREGAGSPLFDQQGFRSLFLSFYILANLVLVSFATADEYWANFANIARLFSPGLLALALDPMIETRFKSQNRYRLFLSYNFLFLLYLMVTEYQNDPMEYSIF